MTKRELNKIDEIIRKVEAGTAMILCTSDNLEVLTLKPGEKLSFMQMMYVLASLGMTYSGETLTYHPVLRNCYRVENSKGDPLAVVHQGIWDCCGNNNAA